MTGIDTRKKKTIVSFLALLFMGAVLYGGYFFFISRGSHPVPQDIRGKNLPTYSESSLKQFDGTNDKLPIYVALDGYVYDVTAGRKFYEVGGTYHRIAGKDASSELHIFGGDIIKSKYPIIGVFQP